MRLILGDQPFLGVSGAACPPTRDAFDAALAADVLHAEADEVLRPAHLDVEELAAAANARFGVSAVEASPWRSHESCSLSLRPVERSLCGFGHGNAGTTLHISRRRRWIRETGASRWLVAPEGAQLAKVIERSECIPPGSA